MSVSFERARAQLQVVDSSGTSLYDHLTDVILRTVTEKQTNVDNMEHISHLVKQARIQVPLYKEVSSVPSDEATRCRILKSLDATSSLLHGPNHLHMFVNNPHIKIPQGPAPPPAQPDDEQPIPEEQKKIPTPQLGVAANHTQLPDLLSQHELWSSGGVSFGEEEMYKLGLSIYQLAEGQSLASIRFFGKILGLRADYWIIEATLSPAQLATEQALARAANAEWEKFHPGEYVKHEIIGVGANKYVYFVTNSSEQPWTRLPNVTPEQIILARQMRRYMTGDLTAPVIGYPRFPSPESSYLRAQIARIAGATHISPKGYFLVDEQDGEEIMTPDEEYEPQLATELLTGDAWVHHSSYLLRAGRVAPWVEPEREDDDDTESVQARKEQPEDEEEEEDDPIPLLTTCEKDQAPKVVALDAPLWTYRISPRSDDPHASVCAHSIVWPGACAVAAGRTFTTCYVGYGQKALGPNKWTPVQPPRVQAEYVSEFNPEQDEVDPLVEQVDPLPPPELPEEKDEDEVTGDEEDEEDEEEDDNEERDD